MAGFGGSVKLTGESEYRKALKDITSNLKLVSSELKLTNTEFANGDKSVKQTKTAYDSMGKAMDDQKAKISALRQALSQAEKEYGSNNEKVKMFKTQLNNAETQLKQMETQTDKSTKELQEMKEGFEDAGKGALTFGDVLKANVLGDVIVGGLKSLGNAVLAVGKTFINIGKQAIESFADFEQLEGGVKKLFGDETSKAVISNANNAFKTAGMSANEYMDTVTSFSASLISSLGGDTEKATGYADKAIRDMADNANTFGTDLSSIQNAYQGFAKGNYTMLDNLKLGFAGSKEGMQSLLDKAGEISGKKFDISSFADITEAIHIMQEEMKIAGTTANEASTTISGSASAMKSAWQNLLTGIADDNADFGSLINNLLESLVGGEEGGGFLNNILPRIQIALDGIVQLIVASADTLLPKVMEMGMNTITGLITGISNNLPSLLSSASTILTTLINGITTALPQLVPVTMQMLTTIIKTLLDNLPQILEMGIVMLAELVKGLAESLPEIIPAMIDAVVLMVETLLDNIDLIIDAGIELILGLADGLIEALPRLIEKAPVIIEKLFDAIIRNLPKIFTAGGELIGKLIAGIVGSFWKLLEKAPEIVANIVKGIAGVDDQIKNAGKNIVEGLWKGISGMASWVYDKIKGFAGNIVGNIKKALGIHSPSKVFEQEVGKNMALGLGEGFTNSMGSITKDMQSAIPTEFDTNATINGINANNPSSGGYANMINAFKEALKDVKVVMNDREMGTFVTDTLERVVYT